MREAAAKYLMATLETIETEDGVQAWYDYASSAQQFGCEALAALGYATREVWGATALPKAFMPDVMPRWDDVARTVLAMMDQFYQIEYRLADGTRDTPPDRTGQFIITPIYPEGQEPEVPSPNIAAANGLGPARLRDDLLLLLDTLGLTSKGAWSKQAELVLWREQPREWSMDVPEDPRFVEGLDRCRTTMPHEITETLYDLVLITPAEITEAVARQEQANADTIARNPSQSKSDRTVTREGRFRSLIRQAENEMDWLFFRLWRFNEGWLSDAEAKRALPLFHDPLAQQMRAATLTAMGLAFPQEMPQ